MWRYGKHTRIDPVHQCGFTSKGLHGKANEVELVRAAPAVGLLPKSCLSLLSCLTAAASCSDTLRLNLCHRCHSRSYAAHYHHDTAQYALPAHLVDCLASSVIACWVLQHAEAASPAAAHHHQ